MRSRQRRSQSSGYQARPLRKISAVNKIRKISRLEAGGDQKFLTDFARGHL
jgi:hypothetical protein